MVAMAWFKLVDYEVDWDKMSLLGIRDVVDMKEAIKARMAPTLDDFPIAGITIKATKGDKNSNNAVTLDSEEDLASILGRFGIEESSAIEVTFAQSIRLFASAAPGNWNPNSLF